MRVWIVVAVLALGLGCSEEPDRWSPSAQQALLVGCFETFGNQMASMGFNPGEACQCVLSVLESNFTESEFLLLGQASAGNNSRLAGLSCYQAMIESQP
jgi:hypothetical protein